MSQEAERTHQSMRMHGQVSQEPRYEENSLKKPWFCTAELVLCIEIPLWCYIFASVSVMPCKCAQTGIPLIAICAPKNLVSKMIPKYIKHPWAVFLRHPFLHTYRLFAVVSHLEWHTCSQPFSPTDTITHLCSDLIQYWHCNQPIRQSEISFAVLKQETEGRL